LKDTNDRIRESARRALENNLSPRAAQVLRAHLDNTAPADWQVALINTMGYRKDRTAVGALNGLTGSADPAVAGAAMDALGAIGGPEAEKALATLKTSAPDPLRYHAVNALLRSAEQDVAAGNKNEAASIYRTLYTPDANKLNRVAALHGLALSEGDAAVPLLAEALTGPDEDLRAAASRFFGDIPGQKATEALAGLLAKTPASGQVLLLQELQERGDTAARPAVSAVVTSPSPEVRAAALQALATVGTAEDVPLLAQLAAANNGNESAAARTSLARLKGTDINAAILTAMKGSPATERVEMMRSLAARNARVAVPDLVTALNDPDAAVGAEALNSLGALGDATTLQPIVTAVVKAKSDTQRDAASKAFTTILTRLPAPSDGAEAVLAALPGADTASRSSLLELLGSTGGTGALAAVKAALKDNSTDVQDTAINVLSSWPDATALPVLLDVARTDTSKSHQVLALRGLVSQVGGADMPAAQKIALLKDAMTLAHRPEDRQLVLSGYGQVADPAALTVLMGYLDNDELKEQASAPLVRLAKTMGGSAGPNIKPMMQKVIATSKNADVTKGAAEVMNAAEVTLRGWRILGPFPLDNGGYDKDYGPEKAVDFEKSYTTSNGRPARWKPATIDTNGYVNLLAQLQPSTNVVAYATVYVKSPETRQAVLSAGSDDGLKAWVNGKLVVNDNVSRPAIPGSDQKAIDLKAGWNQILLKISQGSGDWGYYFDILDTNKQPITDLIYSGTPQG
ncbi:MAG: HEAT repeat domain-containing protein, partial [Armatimonadota bacterium]|nr:HEAT repeat domain-containing protein [Armatimonadota bacterium]